MSLAGALGQANSGLAAIQAELANVAQNVANANTPGYSVQSIETQSVVAGGVGEGVFTGVATRTVNATLQSEVFTSGAAVADSQARSDSLASIDQASGTPGSGQDLPTLIGALRDAFSTLASDPSQETQQRAVVNQAAVVAGGLNTLGQAVTTQRQSAQDQLGQYVSQANAALATVGQLNTLIIAGQSRGESVADLQDKRDAAAQTVTQLTGAQFFPQADGGVLAFSGGTALSTDATSGPLAIGYSTVGAGSIAPPLTVDGHAVSLGSTSTSGGTIGALIDLRDTVLPGIQSQLDSFANALATGFSGQGLTLFSNASGTIPAAGSTGSAGFAETIQVNPAVQATPSMVRDGAAPAGAAGNTTLIDAVLNTVLGTGAGTLSGQASDMIAGFAQQAGSAATALTTNQAVQTSLQTKLSAQTGVSVDSELSSMIALQNSYGANARVVAAVQAMWTQLLSAVQ
jgi:flagellar hook-associated protein 1 FlgK